MSQDAGSSSFASEDAPLLVNLQIVSPSVGVNGPLNFTGIDATTTVRQLKRRIRDTIALRPADDHQRLIHRGRLLACDDETLRDVFGVETLRSADMQTLHLVLRDSVDHRNPTGSATPVPGQAATPGPGGRQSNPSPHPHVPQFQNQPFQPVQPQIGRPAATPGLQNPQFQMQMPQLQPIATGVTPQQWAQQQHQSMLQWMNHLQREAEYRQLVAHNQRARAAMGMHGIQDPNLNPQTAPAAPGPGRQSPATQPETRSYITEGVGPNGQHIRITVNDTVYGLNGPLQPGHPQPVTPRGRSPLSATDVQGIIRGADANQAAMTMSNALHRSASGASLSSLNNSPGVALPRRPGSARPAPRTATPDQARAPVYGSTTAANITPHQQIQTQPEVYILSSPSGPRALLVNGSSGLYYTPVVREHVPSAFPNHVLSVMSATPGGIAGSSGQPIPQSPNIAGHGGGPQDGQQPHPDVAHFRQQRQQVDQEVRQGDNQQDGARQFPLGGAQLHPNNPGAGALVAAIWPHFWLLVRLALFVWWFTSSDTSWYRWITIISLALAVFIVNTGILNGMANQAWDPFRRHLEGLIPLADPNQLRDGGANPVPPAAPRPAQNNVNPAAPGDVGAPAVTPQARQHDPDPSQVAARLVAQRRDANATWVMDQVRRAERAGLLFLASIAPGVAERHIAHLEAEARAERQRREAEEVAAAAQAEVNAASTAATASSGEEGELSDSTRDGEAATGELQQEENFPAADGRHAAPEPVIAI